MNIKEALGGRKMALGYCFLITTSLLVIFALTGKHEPDLLGLSSVIGAQAIGVGAIVWGNVKQHAIEAIEKTEQKKVGFDVNSTNV